jgi:hypothetical protein
MICFSFENVLNSGMYNARLKHWKRTILLLRHSKVYTTEVLLILNQFITYSYGLYSQFIKQVFNLKSILSIERTMTDSSVENERFRLWIERKCHTRKLLIILNRFSSYWYGPYSQRNIATLSFEIDLNDISNNIRSKDPK